MICSYGDELMKLKKGKGLESEIPKITGLRSLIHIQAPILAMKRRKTRNHTSPGHSTNPHDLVQSFKGKLTTICNEMKALPVEHSIHQYISRNQQKIT